MHIPLAGPQITHPHKQTEVTHFRLVTNVEPNLAGCNRLGWFNNNEWEINTYIGAAIKDSDTNVYTGINGLLDALPDAHMNAM